MSSVGRAKASGPKLDQEALAAQRKEKYGFANLAKEQQFRSTAQGEAKALQDKVRELTDMLEDRKNANRLLNTENQRLKKMCQDLQFQMLNKPTARGESAALKSMREMARQFKSREELTAATAEKLIADLELQNQQAMDEMQQLTEDRDRLQAELATTREELSAVTSQRDEYKREAESLMEEKEDIVRRAEEQDQTRLEQIASLEGRVSELSQEVADLHAAAELAKREAEAALRSQNAALEAEALLQRRAAVAELEAEVARLKQLLDKAHESLRSLNQTETLGPGWQLHELGLPPPPPPQQRDPGATAVPPPLSAEPSAASVKSIPLSENVYPIVMTAANEPAAAGSRRVSRRVSRQGSVAGSAAGSVASTAVPSADDAAGAPLLRPLRDSATASVRMGHSDDLPLEPVPGPSPPRAASAVGSGAGGDGSVRGSAAGGGSRVPSEAASIHSIRASEFGGGDDPVAVAVGEDFMSYGKPAGASLPEDGQLMVVGFQIGESDRSGDGGNASGGGSDGSRAPSVAGLTRSGGAVTASRAGSRRSARAQGGSRPGSVAAAFGAADSLRRGPGGPAVPGAAASAAAGGGVPTAPATPRSNILELLLHDASLHPGAVGLPASDLWALLRLACPAIGLVNVGLSIPPPANAGPAGGSSTMLLLHAYRLHFPDDQGLLTAVSAGAARLMLHNLRPAVVGAFSCPRLAPMDAGGGGRGVDGTVERVLVVASRDEYGCSSVDLYCMDEEGRPTHHFQTLSAPWRPQLPDSSPQPQSHEFCIDTNSLHRMQADAARASGLFDTASRVFLGRSDGHMYQVWRLADLDARRKASFKALDRVLVEPAEDPWAAAGPLASAALPLTAALSAPTLTRLELNNVRLLLGDQPVVRLYEPSEDIATKTLACRTTVGEKLVCGVRVTARLARDPEVSEQLLAALQPALQAGAGAPTLPPLHWLSLLGAEELVVERLLTALRGALEAAVGLVMMLPAHDEASRQELEGVLRGAEDAMLLKQRQLEDSLASCAVVAAAASKANPHEAPLARGRLNQVRLHVARSLAEVLAYFRQRVELYRLGAVCWYYTTAVAASEDDPIARTPTTTTERQSKGLARLLRVMAGALQAFAPPGVTAAELLATAAASGAAAAVPLVMLLPPLPPEPAREAPPLPVALADASGVLQAVLSAAVAATKAAAADAFEALRQEVAAPGVDDVTAVELAQKRLATTAAPVTAALVTGMAALCQAAIASSLSEPDTLAALRQQLLAAATAAAPGMGVDSSGVELVAQLVLRLRWQAAVAAGMELGPQAPTAAAAAAASGAGPPAGRAASQLSAALSSLQWLAGNMTGAAPSPVAASRHSVGPWLKASVRLRLQLGVLCTTWSAMAVAAAGHALLLSGQRQAAARLALEVMGREVDRVLDFIKATLESIRANRSYEDSVLYDCMPAVASALTAHAATAVTACFWMAAQMLMTPLLALSYPRQQYIQAAAVAAVTAAKAATSAAGVASDPTASPPPLGAAGGAATMGCADGGIGGGCCYSSSLHIASHESFALMTLGSVSIGNGGVNPAAAVAAAAAPSAEGLPAPGVMEPSLAPLSQPLLSSWQPRGCVLYLDIRRLNAAATAAAAGAPADAAPPTETAGLPHLPAAAELLGWTVRHGEEFYHAYFSAVAAASAARGAGGASRPGSVAASGSVADGAVAPLAMDPVVALSEARLAAEMAEVADVAVVASGRLAEAGSMVKWLSQRSVLVLEAANLQLPGAGGGGADGDGVATRELARTLVGLLATHHLQAATVRSLTPPPPAMPTPPSALASAAASAAPTPRPGSWPVTRRGSVSNSLGATEPPAAARTPRASLSGSVPGDAGAGGASPRARTPTPSIPYPATPAPSAPFPPPSPSPSPSHPHSFVSSHQHSAVVPPPPALQPLAAVTYLPDITIAKPMFEACADLSHRVRRSLQAIQAAFATAPAVAPHSDMLVRHVSRQLSQQVLLLEGLLIAPELVRAEHPGTVPLAGSAAAPVGLLWQPWAAKTGDMALAPPAPPRPSPTGFSRQSSLGRNRPVLPSMTPRRASLTSGLASPAALGGTPPRPPQLTVASTPAADAYSTESEDEEVGVSRTGTRPPVGGAATAAPRPLPDEPDADSDAASIRSASTLGSTFGGRGGPPR